MKKIMTNLKNVVNNLFKPKPNSKKFSIVIPPPNVLVELKPAYDNNGLVEYQDFFACRVEFDQQKNSIIFPSRLN